MATLSEQLVYEIDWRTGELSMMKTVPFLFPFSSDQKSILKKYSVVMMYSLWEGFVAECFSIYSRELNNLKLQRHQISINILVHSLDVKYSLKSGRTDFNKQIAFVKDFCNYIDGVVDLPVNVPTESNVNYKVINTILHRFNLDLLPLDPYQHRLDKLVFFRNRLAHGEKNIPVNQENIDEMSQTVIMSMHAVVERIIEGYDNQSYLAKLDTPSGP